VTSYYLELLNGNDRHENIVPKSAYTSNDGFIAGTEWTPMSIEIYETNDKNKYSYSVIGIVDWNLLGTTIYTQPKRFNGAILTNKANP